MEVKRHRFWVCPGCGHVYIINIIPVQKILGVKVHIGKQEFLLDVMKYSESVCVCGQPIGKESLNVAGLTIDSI